MEELDDLGWREAAAAGARPSGVPLRVYGGYLEARAALRANANQAATRVLEWLLAHIGEERGGRPEHGLQATLAKLQADGAISRELDDELFAQALGADDGRERAWALLSIVEHIFYRVYLRQS
jgi:hypothetical protein